MNSQQRRSHTAIAALVALGALLPACAPRLHRERVDPQPAADSTAVEQLDIPIVVENHNSDDVVVTVRNEGGQNKRLGTVAGNGRGAFTFSERFAAASRRLVLIAHPVGARGSYQSETFTVQRGQSVAWQIQNGFTGSSVAVY